MPAPLRNVLRRLLKEESGQSLIVTVSSMTVLVALAAFGIDASSWMVKHHQTQIVADASAMAAAHCLANPGKSSSIMLNGTQTLVPACTSGNDTADAQTVAVEYAAANGVTISANQVSVNTTSDMVTVNASVNSTGVFAGMFGLRTTTQGANAGASYTASSGSCATPGSGCDFMFAHGSDCSTGGIDLNNSGNTTISGNIISNGDITGHTNGNVSLGSATYGPNNSTGSCSNTLTYNGHNPWTAPPTQASADLPWPIDYSLDFPACGGQLDPCQTNGYPSFCTNESVNPIVLDGSTNGDTAITNQVYCAIGTGVAANPATWNGSITISLQGNNVLYDTFIGGSISFTGSGRDTLSACGYTPSGYSAANCNSSVPNPAPNSINYPIFYATGTSSTALNIGITGNETLNGDMFVPNGTATLDMEGSKTLTSLIEANSIEVTKIAGNFQGDGPSTSGGAGSGGGTVSLVQ